MPVPASSSTVTVNDQRLASDTFESFCTSSNPGHLLGVADALEPAHPRSQLGCRLVEQRVPAERTAAVGRVSVARAGAH